MQRRNEMKKGPLIGPGITLLLLFAYPIVGVAELFKVPVVIPIAEEISCVVSGIRVEAPELTLMCSKYDAKGQRMVLDTSLKEFAFKPAYLRQMVTVKFIDGRLMYAREFPQTKRPTSTRPRPPHLVWDITVHPGDPGTHHQRTVLGQFEPYLGAAPPTTKHRPWRTAPHRRAGVGRRRAEICSGDGAGVYVRCLTAWEDGSSVHASPKHGFRY